VDEFGLSESDPLIAILQLLAVAHLGFTNALDSFDPKEVSRSSIIGTFYFLEAVALRWLNEGRLKILENAAAHMREFAVSIPSPAGFAIAARFEAAMGNFEAAKQDLARAEKAFPAWADWHHNSGQLINLRPFMDGVIHALVLQRTGEPDQAKQLLKGVLDRIELMEQGGFGMPMIKSIKAKALYLEGRQDEAQAALEEGFEQGMLLPPGMDMEWRAVFGDDPTILAFEKRMDQRRDELRKGIPEPDLSNAIKVGVLNSPAN
jgi:hypothetical protein